MTFQKTYAQLRRYVRDLTTHHSELEDERSQAFPYWFSQAALLHPDDKDAILKSLIGGKNDKNIDVIAFSSVAQDVYVCQTKYRDTLKKYNEKGSDLNEFARIAGYFAETNEERFLAHFPYANDDVRARLREVWPLVRRHGYGLQLFYVSTGKVSTAAVAEARKIAAGSNPDAHLVVYDGHDCCRLFEDFQSLVPAIPFIELHGVRDRMSVHSSDGIIKSVVCPARVNQVKAIFRKHGERLFARNVRLDKGETASVNKQIAASLKNEPSNFLYYNNGLTILGRSVEVTDDASGEAFNVKIYEPQIINGQQTTRTIGRTLDLSSVAEVLVRIVCREPKSDEDVAAFRHFISTVVRATNSQTKVSASELAANNPEQIAIEKAFRYPLQWRYVRKVGKSDVKSPYWTGRRKPFGTVKLKELAAALVSCLYQPNYIRQIGVETIFEVSPESKKLYAQIFSEKRSSEEYLFAHLVMLLSERTQNYKSKQLRQLAGLGQYFVAQRVFAHLKPVFSRDQKKVLEALGARMYKRQYSAAVSDLRRSIEIAWQSFFKARRENDEDPLSFVSSLGDHEWDRYWGSGANRSNRSKAAKAVKELSRELEL